MPKKSSASKIRLSSFNDLFGLNDVMSQGVEVRNVMLDELFEFEGHPFKVCDNEKMEELTESVREHGVLVPGIARIRAKGGYEIIAGHSRKRACEKAGLSVMPMYIRNMSDDEATIVMVDSNIQREDILPSEKARAYKMKYDAMKHQGKKGNSLKAMGEESGESRNVVQRYIWLANLSDELLEMVDAKKLGFTQGVDISFLRKTEQEWLSNVVNKLGINISIRQSAKIKTASKEGKLTEARIWELLSPVKDERKQRKILLKADKLDSYFPDNYSENDIEKVIIELLDKWKAEGV